MRVSIVSFVVLSLSTTACGNDNPSRAGYFPDLVVSKECSEIQQLAPFAPEQPVITLRAPKVVVLRPGQAYVEPGATATDPQDGDLSAAIVVDGADDIQAAGDHLIRYNVHDSAGVAAREMVRIVRVTDAAFQRMTLRPFGSTAHGMAYFEHLPDDFGADPDAKHPLLIFHPGWGGDRQQDPELHTMAEGGMVKLVQREDWDASLPFVILSAQRCFSEVTDTEVQRANAFLDYAISTYSIDPSRVYMAGFSDGAFLTWRYAARYPERLAAIAPISGGTLRSDACRLRQVPAWAFYGGLEKGFDEFLDLFRSINACAPRMRPKLTLFPEAKHDFGMTELSFGLKGLGGGDPLYDIYDQSIYGWFLQYRSEQR